MDLMYSCGSDIDISLQELVECDLKSEMDRIIAVSGGNPDIMTELANAPLLAEEGIEEFGFNGLGGERLLDPYGLSHGFGFNSLAASLSSSNCRGSLLLDTNGNNTNSNFHHRSTSAKSAASNIEWKIQSNLMSGLNFDESYGILVDPSSIIPVSVSSSVASSASGSETDPECLATDEEEEEDIINGKINGSWMIPERISSRTPSPNGETEFEMDEPEFILTETIPEGPPPKKRKQKHEPQPHTDGKIYPKPGFSYSCLIAMSLKNSKTGCLPVSEIYKFMCDHFPYFKSAPSGWKNSVRHNLSLNKCFEKIEKPGTGARKGCLWALNPAKIHKMDEEVQKWSRKDPLSIRRAMSDPENLELIERGELKRDYSGAGASDEDEEEDFSGPATPAQLQARRNRQGSSDSTNSVGESRISGNSATKISQIRTTLHRPIDSKLLVKHDDMDFATIQNVQGNYSFHGNNTYSISFSNMNNSPTTPLIIRRTPVK